jgi:hypothetical protein
MHAVNFHCDEGYLLSRHPSSSSNCASISASNQAPSSSTRPLFAHTASALYLPSPSAFYATGTCFFFLVIFCRLSTAYFFWSMADLYFYRETTDTYETGVFVMGRSFTCSVASV